MGVIACGCFEVEDRSDMKYLALLVILIGSFTVNGQKSDYRQAVDHTLRSQWKKGRKRQNVIVENDSLKLRYVFWDDNKAFLYVQTSSVNRYRDTIVNYRFQGDKLLRIEFGFKKNYSLYYFKDGQLMEAVVRKRGWKVRDINIYLQKGNLYLHEAKKIQDTISH